MTFSTHIQVKNPAIPFENSDNTEIDYYISSYITKFLRAVSQNMSTLWKNKVFASSQLLIYENPLNITKLTFPSENSG